MPTVKPSRGLYSKKGQKACAKIRPRKFDFISVKVVTSGITRVTSRPTMMIIDCHRGGRANNGPIKYGGGIEFESESALLKLSRWAAVMNTAVKNVSDITFAVSYQTEVDVNGIQGRTLLLLYTVVIRYTVWHIHHHHA